MEHQIGDIVVRKWQGKLLWSMTGVITRVNHTEVVTFYSIRWNRDDIETDRWQAEEFEVIA